MSFLLYLAAAGLTLLTPPLRRFRPAAAHPVTTELAVQIYQIRIGPDLFARRVQLGKKASNILADPSLTPADRAARYRGEILVPLRGILADAESYVPPDDRVAQVHQHCVAALRLAVTANESVAFALELNKQVLLTLGQTMLRTESTQWRIWANEVSQLSG